MADTPLSDHITRFYASQAKADYAACAQAFLDAEVGLWIPGLEGAPGQRVYAGGLEIPTFRAPNGVAVLRVCADPDVFVTRFDPRLNARLSGREAGEMLLKLDDSIAGVLLDSAASEHSVLFPRADLQAWLAPRGCWSWLRR